MPLEPNVIERQLLKRGVIPPLMIDGAASQFSLSAVIAAMETGVPEVLGAEPGIATHELAARTGTDARAMESLLIALRGIGWVEDRKGGWALTRAARQLPLAELPRFVPFLKDQGRRNLDGARALREAPEGGIVGWDVVREGEVGESYQAVMRWLASGSVQEVAKRVKLPDGARRLLDVGGSHGLYSVAFCRRNPQLSATVLDWAIGLREAERTLSEDGADVAERIDLAEVDFEREEPPGGYDAAFLGNIVHGLTVEGNTQLFEKLGRATNPGARVVILDQVQGGRKGSRFARGVAGLIGWNLFLFSGGRSHSVEDLSGALAAGGFHGAKRIDLRRSPGFSLVIASKAPA